MSSKGRRWWRLRGEGRQEPAAGAWPEVGVGRSLLGTRAALTFALFVRGRGHLFAGCSAPRLITSRQPNRDDIKLNLSDIKSNYSQTSGCGDETAPPAPAPPWAAPDSVSLADALPWAGVAAGRGKGAGVAVGRGQETRVAAGRGKGAHGEGSTRAAPPVASNNHRRPRTHGPAGGCAHTCTHRHPPPLPPDPLRATPTRTQPGHPRGGQKRYLVCGPRARKTKQTKTNNTNIEPFAWPKPRARPGPGQGPDAVPRPEEPPARRVPLGRRPEGPAPGASSARAALGPTVSPAR